MSLNFSDLESAYKSAYKLKLFSDVRIRPKLIASKATFSNSEKKDLLLVKRWQVYYEFRNPDTGVMERVPPRSFGVNKISDFEERRKRILWIRDALQDMLESGWSPFDKPISDDELMSCEGALLFALDLIRASVSVKTYSDYESRIKGFVSFLKSKRVYKSSIQVVSKKVVTQFLDGVMKRTSAKNRNNYQSALSSVFSTLADRDIIERNFILDIKKAMSNSVHNTPFSKSQQTDIESHLIKTDPYLLKYIQVFSWQFLRPVEVNRLMAQSINLDDKILYVPTKTKALKKKRIPEMLIPLYKDLIRRSNNPKDYLFTPQNKPGAWARSEDDRRDYFTKRFKKKVIDPLGLEPEFKMYGFRHTMATHLANGLISENGFEKGIDLFMEVSGHSTRKAAMTYLKQIDAVLPQDWSRYFE